MKTALVFQLLFSVVVRTSLFSPRRLVAHLVLITDQFRKLVFYIIDSLTVRHCPLNPYQSYVEQTLLEALYYDLTANEMVKQKHLSM